MRARTHAHSHSTLSQESDCGRRTEAGRPWQRPSRTPGSATQRTLLWAVLCNSQLVAGGVSCPSGTDSSHTAGARRPRLDLPAIPLGHPGVPETSLRAQRPRCPLWAHHSCKTHSQESSALGTTTHRHPVSVLKCGNLSTLYHLPPHPPGLGIAPPLPIPFRLTADTREYGPSSFWGWTPP